VNVFEPLLLGVRFRRDRKEDNLRRPCSDSLQCFLNIVLKPSRSLAVFDKDDLDAEPEACSAITLQRSSLFQRPRAESRRIAPLMESLKFLDELNSHSVSCRFAAAVTRNMHLITCWLHARKMSPHEEGPSRHLQGHWRLVPLRQILARPLFSPRREIAHRAW
jgi:hypothetical protein